MAKTIFEQLSGTYHEENGYLIPNLKLPAEEGQAIGIWGQWHLCYLKQHHIFTYQSSHKRQSKRLSCRHRQTGTGTL